MNISLILFILIAKSLIVSSFKIDSRPRQLSKYGDADKNFMSYNRTTHVLKIRWSAIYPGTKWCGAGEIARSYYDLGRQRSADMCCRTHDYCDDYIPAGETKHGLTNTGLTVKLSCECDERFRQCLRLAGSDTADIIGIIYFDILDRECFSRSRSMYWDWYAVENYFD